MYVNYHSFLSPDCERVGEKTGRSQFVPIEIRNNIKTRVPHLGRVFFSYQIQTDQFETKSAGSTLIYAVQIYTPRFQLPF